MASTSISALKLFKAKALSGFAMPAWARAFSSEKYIKLLNADTVAGHHEDRQALGFINIFILINERRNHVRLPT